MSNGNLTSPRTGNEPDSPLQAVFSRKLMNPACCLILIIITGLLVYSNSYHSPFVFDDEFNIVTNAVVKNLSYFINPSKAAEIDPYLHKYLISRYVGYLSLALNYKLHGLEVYGYHVFNVAMHIFNALLVYQFVMLILQTPFYTAVRETDSSILDQLADRRIALLTALMFVAHPIQTESVTYIFQRLTSLAAFFYLLSLIYYLKARLSLLSDNDLFSAKHAYYYFLAFVSALLAMKTKENAFTLPVAIGICEFLFFTGRIQRRLLFLTPLLLTMLVVPAGLLYSAYDQGNLSHILDETTRLQTDMTRTAYLLTQFRVICTYLRLLFIPVGQNLDYDYPISLSFWEPGVLASFVLLTLLSVAACVFISRARSGNRYYRLAGFGIVWFFLTLAVESSIIPIEDVIFEHRMYLPSMGIFIVLSAGFANWCGTKGAVGNTLFRVVTCVVVTAVGLLTFQRNIVWQSGVSLWRDVVQKSPNKARPYINLGNKLLENKLYDEAVENFLIAVKLKPDYEEAHHHLGLVYGKMGRLDESAKELAIVTRLNPRNAKAYGDLGVTYDNMGLLSAAKDNYLHALRLKSDNFFAHNNLGLLYMKEGSFAEAENSFTSAVTLNPDYANAWKNLGDLYGMKGDSSKAAECYRKATAQ